MVDKEDYIREVQGRMVTMKGGSELPLRFSRRSIQPIRLLRIASIRSRRKGEKKKMRVPTAEPKVRKMAESRMQETREKEMEKRKTRRRRRMI